MCRAQSTSTLLGARSASLGYASATLSDDWALFNNPAGLSSIKVSSAAFAVEVTPSLEGANRLGAAFNQPFSWGVVSVGAFRFGDNLYNEQLLSVGAANRFGNTSLGMRASLIQYRSTGAESRQTVGITLGGITELTDRLKIGAYAINLNLPSFKGEEGSIPTLLLAGVSYRASEKVWVATEIEKDVERDLIWKTGLEYQLNKKVAVRTGYWLQPSSLFMGLGFKPGRLIADYALHYSFPLGARHQVSAIYSIPAKRKAE